MIRSLLEVIYILVFFGIIIFLLYTFINSSGLISNIIVVGLLLVLLIGVFTVFISVQDLFNSKKSHEEQSPREQSYSKEELAKKKADAFNKKYSKVHREYEKK